MESKTDWYEKNTKWFMKTYDSLINRAKTRGLVKKELNYYTELHHIIPKCLGGTDEDSNLVLLTFREHVIAHMLLFRIHEDNYDLALAVNLLTHIKRDGVTVKISSTRWMNEISNILKRHNHNRIFSEETKQKISKARKGIKYNKETYKKAARSRVGLNMTKESKDKKSKALTGKIVSENTRKLISEKSSRKIIGPDGTIYESQIKCAEALGVCTRTIWKFIHRKPELGYKFLEEKSKKVQGPDGTIYDSIRKCAISIGKDPTTVKNWIEKYPEQGYKYYIGQ